MINIENWQDEMPAFNPWAGERLTYTNKVKGKLCVAIGLRPV
jgi:hypothetical protein